MEHAVLRQGGVEPISKIRLSLPDKQTNLIALLGCAAYYAGAAIGFALTLPTDAVSTLWPPNAILLACLLLTPTRQWGVLLLGVLPAHVAVQLQSGVPTLMIFCWFLSNSSEALIGAYCVRRLIGGPLRFDSFRDAGVFVIFAVLLAPFVSSFIDAAFVVLVEWKAGAYWQVWRTRFTGNVLAELTLVPFIVLWAANGVAWLRRASLRRYAEACLLACGLLTISVLVFSWQSTGPGTAPALVYLPLPFLLWAAVRFGPAGASTSLLVVVLVSIWAATQGRGPFISRSPPENVLSLQIFLIAVSLPLIFLAALIEERRGREAALRASEARYRALVMAGAEMVWRADARGEVSFATDAWQELTGQTDEDIQDFGWLAAVHPDDRERSRQLWEQAIIGKGMYENELRVRTRNSGYRYFHAHAVPILAADGTVHEWIGANTDITDRKKAESELRQQREELARISRISTMGELAASLAHELNQPLTAILSNAQAAQRFLAAKPADLEEVLDILKDIVQDNTRAGEVIHRMRALAKKEEVAFVRLDLAGIIRDVVAFVHSDAILHGVRVLLKLNDGLPPAWGDKVQLQQVVLNLLLNAFDAMEDCPASEREVLVQAKLASAEMLEVSVRDRGVGVSTNELEKIFQPFYTTKREGMGMGLCICRSIVNSHRGRLWADNNPDRGATFYFTVPVGKGAD